MTPVPPFRAELRCCLHGAPAMTDGRPRGEQSGTDVPGGRPGQAVLPDSGRKDRTSPDFCDVPSGGRNMVVNWQNYARRNNRNRILGCLGQIGQVPPGRVGPGEEVIAGHRSGKGCESTASRAEIPSP